MQERSRADPRNPGGSEDAETIHSCIWEGDRTCDTGGMTELAALLARAVADLERIGAADEALAVLRDRGIGRLRGKPYLSPIGRAWRLGVVLLDRLGGLYETGEITRAIEPQIAVTNRSADAELKREYRRAAARGPFPEGETINHGFTPLDLSDAALRDGSGPLSLDGDVVLVRLLSGGRIPLERYLADRVSLFQLD